MKKSTSILLILFWLPPILFLTPSTPHSTHSALNTLFSPSDTWMRQQTPTRADLAKISFTDSLYGWSAGDSGVIIHTMNGGQNWILQNSGINYHIDDLFFLNRRLGWAVANDYFNYGSTILSTTNGGLNWTHYRYPDTTLVLNVITFLDSLNGWLAGYSRVMLRTTNGGLTWASQQIDSSNECFAIPTRGIVFYSPQFGFACGGHFDIAGHVLRTINGGLSWQPTCMSPEPVYDLIFFDSLHLIGCGGDFEYGASIIKTSNGGVNWQYTPLNIFGAGQAIAFRTQSEGWIPLGFSGTWTYTLDSGITWHEMNGPDSSYVYDAVFTDTLNGWACGSGGMILKYNTAIIGIQNQNQGIPESNVLYQNYPNPFNPSTTIEFSLAKTSEVRIVIYDVAGREVRKVLNEVFGAGSHKIRFNSNGLPSGVYFYTLTSAGYTETKKLVIMK